MFQFSSICGKPPSYNSLKSVITFSDNANEVRRPLKEDGGNKKSANYDRAPLSPSTIYAYIQYSLM